jgi:L-ascorbate metabolism protein UlaG (beta-lactamase superfamily)
VTSALRHLADVVGYAATRRGHDAADLAALEHLTTSATALDLPAGVEVRWLGVAGFALSHEGTTVLIDPYVTRLGLGDLVRRRVVGADLEAIDRFVPRADAVLVGHTHFDHALDVPAIARRDRCQVYGGSSSRNLLGLHGLARQAVEVEPHRTYEIGPFEITFVPSLHAKLALGLAVPNGGELTCDHVDGLTPQAYCCGQVWGIHIAVAGATIYHQGSANLVEDEIRHRDVDVFLCGIAGRQFTEAYTSRIIGRLRPRTVVISHHDDFFRPIEGPPALAFGVDVERFHDEVATASPDATVVALPRPAPVRN